MELKDLKGHTLKEWMMVLINPNVAGLILIGIGGLAILRNDHADPLLNVSIALFMLGMVVYSVWHTHSK